MTRTAAAELISKNLTAIYGYAFGRLCDKDKVDDLTSEIVCEILASAQRLRDDAAFWGFAWRIAENTFRRFIRREKAQAGAEELDAQTLLEASTENEYLAGEDGDKEIYLLRRELSLLTKIHREVCVAYYVENKSCSLIAKQQNISVEMVKYHLFKTRKLLKEGIGMTRTLGEKSYNPGTFRLNFWGDRNRYDDLFRRKLPGSIMLAAYHLPMTAEELSMELGVAMPYLEDELEMLQKAGVLAKIGNKYQTNLVILTDDYETEFERNIAKAVSQIADSVFETAKSLLPSVRELDFQGNDYDDNRLLFALLNIAMVNAYDLADERSPLGPPNKLALGGNGWLFGHDNDCANRHFNGITMETKNKARTAWFSAENYRVIAKSQIYDHSRFSEKAEAMCDAVLGKIADVENQTIPYLVENGFVFYRDGVLSANFPVFSEQVYKQLLVLLRPLTETVAECMIAMSDKAECILRDHVPKAVRAQCADIAKIHHRLDVSAMLMEEIIGKGKLTVPSQKTPLCVWGVRL